MFSRREIGEPQTAAQIIRVRKTGHVVVCGVVLLRLQVRNSSPKMTVGLYMSGCLFFGGVFGSCADVRFWAHGGRVEGMEGPEGT